MNEHFIEGFVKTAKKEEEKHYLRRTLLGTPISGAIKAKSGKKWETFKDSWIHQVLNSLAGTGIGGAAGAGLGALAARKGKAGLGAIAGAGLGANLGGMAGGLKGNYDSKATEIHNRYAKDK